MRAIALALLAVLATDAAPRQISQSGFGAFEASLTPFGEGFAAAWYDTRDGHAEIYARLLDADGQSKGQERRLTSGDHSAYEPDIATVGDQLIVAWYERAPNAMYRAMVGAWTADGRQVWMRRVSPEGRYGRSAVVRVAGADIFCAWLEYVPGGNPDVWAQWLDQRGQPLGGARRVAPAGRTTWNLNAAIDAQGTAWVAFDAKAATTSEELFLARVDRTASHVVRLTADDGKSSKYPDIAFSGGAFSGGASSGGRAAITWFDERDGNQEVYLFVAPSGSLSGDLSADLKEGIEIRARRVTETPGESVGAYLAWNGDTVGLAWCDNTVGQHEIYFEPFDAAGAPLAQARRLTDNPTQSLIPAIRPARDGFALVWNEFTPGPAGGHDARGKSEVAFTLVH